MPATFREQREAICRRVGEARQASGRSREGFSQNLAACSRLAVSARDVRRFERTHVPWAHLDEIARLTGTTRDWLLHGDSEARAGEAPEELWAGSIWDDPSPFRGDPGSVGRPPGRGRTSVPIDRIVRGVLLGVPLGLAVQALTRPALGAVVLALAVGVSLLRQPKDRRLLKRR